MTERNEAFLASHFVIVANDGDEVDIAHRDSCERIERDGYFDYVCGVGWQITESGGAEISGIEHDGIYLVTPWFTAGRYDPKGGAGDPDYGMEVIELQEKVDAR